MPGLPKPDLIAAAANSWTSVADSFPMANFLKSKTNKAHGSAMACGLSFWALARNCLVVLVLDNFHQFSRGGMKEKHALWAIQPRLYGIAVGAFQPIVC